MLTTVLHCDNRGVISHSNSPLTALPEKQKQANLIRLIKYLGGSNRCRTSWEWVKGHAVERKGRRRSLLPERLNDQVDKLTKQALVHAVAGGHVMTGDFLFEVVKFKLSGQRVCGSPWQALKANWGYRAAQELFYEKDIIHREDFHLVWWEGLGAAMAWYPEMYRVWLTKHVSGFCGNNVQQYYCSKGTHSPKYKFCGIEDEYSTHICQCKDPGRDSMFRILVSKVHTWLVATLGENTIASTVEEYLLGRRRVTMESCLYGTYNNMSVVSMMSDRLGWDSFLEGRISKHWLVVVLPLLPHRPLQLLPESWGRQFISKLHNVIYKQWTYCNSMIHFWSTDGLTIPEHYEILNRIESYSLADTDTLLPRHQSLYTADFAALGGGPTLIDFCGWLTWRQQ